MANTTSTIQTQRENMLAHNFSIISNELHIIEYARGLAASVQMLTVIFPVPNNVDIAQHKIAENYAHARRLISSKATQSPLPDPTLQQVYEFANLLTEHKIRAALYQKEDLILDENVQNLILALRT